MSYLALALAELMRDCDCVVRTLRVTTKENVTTDTLSRGSAAVALRLAKSMHLAPTRLRVSESLFDVMRRAIEPVP